MAHGRFSLWNSLEQCYLSLEKSSPSKQWQRALEPCFRNTEAWFSPASCSRLHESLKWTLYKLETEHLVSISRWCRRMMVTPDFPLFRIWCPKMFSKTLSVPLMWKLSFPFLQVRKQRIWRVKWLLLFYFIFLIKFLFLLYFTLQYCIGFPYIDMNPPRAYMRSQTWTPPPTSLPITSLWSNSCWR